jgi:hypothetical protein
MTTDSKCPYVPGKQSNDAPTNREWWPNQLNLKVLQQHSPLTDPMDENFDYAKEFKSLNLKTVKKDIEKLLLPALKDIVGTSNIFQRVFEGPGPAETTQPTQQNGGGWTIDLANTIDKFPTYQRYDDEAPPVILNGKTYLSNSCQSQCGAGKISLYKVKKMSVKKLNHKSKPKTKSNKMTKTKRHHNLKMRKSKSKSKSRSKSKSS